MTGRKRSEPRVGGQLTLAALLAFSAALALGWPQAGAPTPPSTIEVVVTPSPTPGVAVPQP